MIEFYYHRTDAFRHGHGPYHPDRNDTDHVDAELQAPAHLERTQEIYFFHKVQSRWEFPRVCRCVAIGSLLYLSTDHTGKARTS